jgi:hypothetical protein
MEHQILNPSFPLVSRVNKRCMMWSYYDTFTLDVKSVLNENLGGILGGNQC